MLSKIKKELRSFSSPEKAKILSSFFKTGPGQYGSGDKFLGVKVPEIRSLVKKYSNILTIEEIAALLDSAWHEERLLALLLLVKKFEQGDEKLRGEIYKLYLDKAERINNWDLVDLSADRIVGAYLENRDKIVLNSLVQSTSLWERRIAILATFYYVKRGKPEFTLAIAERLLNDKHDLIHKAVGWMLREVGKRCSQRFLEEFLDKHVLQMPRTMLRYAIERLPEGKRKYYLNKK